jgi:diaminopimelate decarboxylase
MDWEIKDFLKIQNNQLFIEGVSTIDMAEKFDTPLFVFSEKRIKHNIERLKHAEKFIECKLKICYAAKANSNMAILRTVRESGAELEVNSGGELWKALKVGFNAEQIIFNGTSKTVAEIEAAITAEIYAIQVDSLYELELIETLARTLQKCANVSLRLVPEIETKTHSGLQTALLTSKFGMMPDEALSAFRRFYKSDFLNLCGIHLHIGSQTPDAAPYADAFKTLFENLLQIYNETGHKLSHLNLGGGFPVNYLLDKTQAGDFLPVQRDLFSAHIEPEEVLRQAWKVVEETAQNAKAFHLLENITLLLEPGRSVVADAGICLTTVRNHKKRPLKQLADSNQQLAVLPKGISIFKNLEIKEENQSKMQNDFWLLTDAGFNILLSMETYKWYYHLISAARAGETHSTPYKVAGPLCDGGDVYFDIEGENRLPDYRLLPENVQPDEVLALLNCGAYSVAQMSQYNGRQLPAIILIKDDGEIELIRRRDSYEDLLGNDIW